MTDTVLVTGADGFIGRTLCEALGAAGRGVRRAVRRTGATSGAVTVGDIGPETDWSAALEGVDSVVHLAARTHVLDETAADPLAEYRRINVGATEQLARSAAARGVRRLVFLSSVKVNGERTASRPYTESDEPRPEDAYGISKWEAEQALARIAAETGLQVVVLRPPLVYGPGVKGNFRRLLRIVARGTPLLLASLDNRRSLVNTGNLVEVIVKSIDTPRAAGRTYLVSDGEDVSTPGLVRAIAAALGVKARLLRFPPILLQLGATFLGKGGEFKRLAGSLQVDDSATRRELAWQPRYTVAQGLERTAQWYWKSVSSSNR